MRAKQTGLSRRTLLGRGVAALGALSLPARALAIEPEQIRVKPESLERVAEVFSTYPVVDFHTHLGIWQNLGLEGEQQIPPVSRAKLASNIQEYLDAGVNCVYLDTISDLTRTRIGAPGNKDRDFSGDEAWEEYQRQFALMQELVAELPLTPITATDSLHAIAMRGELAFMLSTEGAHMVEHDPARLDRLAANGFRRLQTVHYVASELGDNQTDPPRFNGLSTLGKQVTARAAALGMLLDMAHASQAVVEDTLSLVDKPLALSHTMVKFDSPRFGDYRKTRSRWVTPEHARLIADSGGVVGTFPLIAPYGVDTLDAFVEALIVMIDTVGTDHVAWSTDLGEPVRPGFLADYRMFPSVCARLLESGLSDADLGKFIGDNALRVQREAAA